MDAQSETPGPGKLLTRDSPAFLMLLMSTPSPQNDPPGKKRHRGLSEASSTGAMARCLFLLAAGGLVSCIHVPKTTADDAGPSRTIVGDYAFHTESFGNPAKPPVIVVHGGPGGDFEYLRSLSALGDEFHVLFYDERGSGLSPRLEKNTLPIPIAQYVEDLNALATIHGKGQPIRLIGHSWGAMIATAYIARHPERVSHAVIAEPGILRPASGRPFIERLKAGQKWTSMLRAVPVLFKALFVRSLDGQERMDYIVTQMAGSGEGPPYQCEGERLPAGSFRRMSYASMMASVGSLMDNPDSFPEDLTIGIDGYRGRLLMLSSSCSFIGYDYQEEMHRKLMPEGTRHVRLEATGHNMFTVRPEKAIDIVRAFLR